MSLYARSLQVIGKPFSQSQREGEIKKAREQYIGISNASERAGQTTT